jgi:hypothetical protein
LIWLICSCEGAHLWIGWFALVGSTSIVTNRHCLNFSELRGRKTVSKGTVTWWFTTRGYTKLRSISF